MNRAEVEAALGKPTAALTKGTRLVLVYPHGGRVELEQGGVTTAVNVAMDTGTADAPAATSPAPLEPKVEAPPPKTDAAQAKAEAKMERLRQENQRRLEEITERLEADHGKVHITLGPRPGEFWKVIAVGWLCRILITVVVLKAAFKWSDVHADWGQMFIPALADALTQSGIQAAVYAIWKTDQLFHLDAAVSFFVLLGVLMKTTHACTLQRAVAVAGAAKLASLVMWALLSVIILQLMT